MNINKMLKHCQKPLKLTFGELSLNKPHILMKVVICLMKPYLYNDKPFKKGLPTAKSFRVKDEKGFETEMAQLTKLIKKMHKSLTYFELSRKHPIFGQMKSWMWGQSAYKHLDHHLKQFGA